MARAGVVKDRRSDWRIVNASGASDVCGFAADELQKYIKRISLCELPITSEVAAEKAIILGLRADLGPADDQLPSPAKGYDGYAIAVSSTRIVIGGDNVRGVVYGVYDLLERLGCRWFYPQLDPRDREVLPSLDNIEFATGKIAVASPVMYRIYNGASFFFEIDPEVMRRELDIGMKARYNGIGWQCDHRTCVGDQYKAMQRTGVIGEIAKRGMHLHGPAHSFPHFMKNEYFDEHPDWFGMRDDKRVQQVFGGAQFCWSNPEARRKFIENAERFVLESPALDIFCTLGFDGGECCECPECKRSTPADLIFQLMNELLQRLAASAPSVVLEMSGGYNPVHDPPDKTKADERLRVIWAHWGRYMGFGYDDKRYGWIDNLETWRKAVPGRLTLCQYYTDNFATPWVSAPYVTVVEGDRRYFREKGVSGLYMLVYPRGYWWNHAFNAHMAGRCFYDFSLSPDEVLDDYAASYFGKAGPLLAAYYGQWAKEIDLCYRVRDGATDSDRAMLAEQRRLWIDPAVEAVRDDPVLSHRVGKVARLHRVAEMLAESGRRREKVVKLRTTGKFGEARKLLERARGHADQTIAYMGELAALDQGLIDRNEVPGFIALGIKNWIDEEAKKINARDTGEG